MSGCRTHADLAETRLARLTRLLCTQVPGNAKHINLRWRLPNNGAFAATAQQPADHLAEYRAAHASEAEAQERGQLHGWGAEREPMLQVECMKERARADELALELERANARNQELQLRGSVTRGVGTTLYMSPEQKAGLPYDHKVDVYSAGIIFLEMVHPVGTQMERIVMLSALQRRALPR